MLYIDKRTPQHRWVPDSTFIKDGCVVADNDLAAFTHEESLLVSALGLGADTVINPSGGPLAANPVMATGLVRISEAASQIRNNGKHRTLGHSTSGPCLQQNLVCILEGDSK